ncbi:hypothetical protein ABZP36_014592 [Zizania latifolia]
MAAPGAAMDELDNILNSVMERLLNLSLQDGGDNGGATTDGSDAAVGGSGSDQQHVAVAAPAHPPQTSAAWADVLVSEMSAAVSADDARARAFAVLGAFGDAVAHAASAQNAVLKKAVLVQQRRHLAQEERQRELQMHARDLEEKVKSLEASNYALSVHLRQADLHRDGFQPWNRKIF